ncbi:hypothetical protein [Tenacibaculum aiptasiae]|uniref:hypothetical protein n=1 Tax=Tenacibaculum aiptasiae TaxID=426481 RepID=UPI00232DD0BC|nr:hypothetical protein [Tenacibaculum aiptasiae]
MLKNISKLGVALSKKEQKLVNGGWRNIRCFTYKDCPPWDSFCLNGFCQFK